MAKYASAAPSPAPLARFASAHRPSTMAKYGSAAASPAPLARFSSANRPATLAKYASAAPSSAPLSRFASAAHKHMTLVKYGSAAPGWDAIGGGSMKPKKKAPLYDGPVTLKWRKGSGATGPLKLSLYDDMLDWEGDGGDGQLGLDQINDFEMLPNGFLVTTPNSVMEFQVADKGQVRGWAKAMMGDDAPPTPADQKAPASKPKPAPSPPPPQNKDVRNNRKPADQKAAKESKLAPKEVDWSHADKSLWKFITTEYDGSYNVPPSFPPRMEQVTGPLKDAMKMVREDPTTYIGIAYQSDMMGWPADKQCYTKVYRDPKSYFTVVEEEDAPFMWMEASYHALALPGKVKLKKDKYTDTMLGTWRGQPLGKPRMPGRGDGSGDVPTLSIIGDVDPNDVNQGGIGDCWFLSAISALAEFSGAVKELFKNTPNIEKMPLSNESNSYTVTLYDLSTWEPVDIVVDERLCTKSDGSSLLGCSPSINGDLWACYLEKAAVAHCGGWDKMEGGQCTHAWRLLTGCQDCYTFMVGDGKVACLGTLNPKTGKHEELKNSPQDGSQSLWPVEWPAVGGGGKAGSKVSTDEFFEKMCAWDDNNYIMAAGTGGGDDSHSTEGIVDGHAYTVLTCVNDAGGSEFDLIKVRNPWGHQEFQGGMWGDDGQGWKKYPKVKAAINPVQANDGVFWLEKSEFFTYFEAFFLCAKDMSEFIED